MSVPRVTVVIPCYNHGRYVADAVRSCVSQESAEVRVVIVNDGSNDGSTPGACDRCVELAPGRVVVVHQKNRGLSAARNAGALEAKRRGGEWAGEYLTFLDADDWIEPTFVSKLHAAMVRASQESEETVRGKCLLPVARNAAELMAAARAQSARAASENGHGGGATAVVAEAAGEGEPVELVDEWSFDDVQVPGRASHAYCQERLVELHQMTWAVPEWDAKLMLVTNLHPVTTLIRRECFEAVGGFDETMNEGYEDWDLWLKFVERGWRGVRVREPLFIWRRHSETTMIVEAGKRHERLYGQLVTNHLRLYLRHGPELMVLSNRLLRQSDANWLDETGEAIVVRDTRNWAQSLAIERDAARNEIGVLQAARQADAAALEAERRQRHTLLEQLTGEQGRAATMLNAYAAELAEAKRTIAMYERKPVVRLSRAAHRVVDRMPRPIGGTIRACLRLAKRLIPSRARGVVK
ncbi:MAG: glycosyltransferase family 2 protein [Phycisphaerales bacterium]